MILSLLATTYISPVRFARGGSTGLVWWDIVLFQKFFLFLREHGVMDGRIEGGWVDLRGLAGLCGVAMRDE